MIKKHIYQIFLLLFFVSCLFSQEKEKPFRIGSNKVTPITFGEEFNQELFDKWIQTGLIKVVGLTEERGWDKQFQVISNNDKIVKEKQKEIEKLEDCSDEECAFELGQILYARYILDRRVEYIPPKNRTLPSRPEPRFENYDITLEIIDIASNKLLFAISETIELNFDDSRKKKADKLKDEIGGFISMMFEDAFIGQPLLPAISKNQTRVFGNNTQSSSSVNLPEVKDITKNITHDEAIRIKLEAEDIDDDKFTFLITRRPVNGEATITSDGYLDYRPFKNFQGRDEIGYIAKDSDGLNSNNATITIRISNATPVAYDRDISIIQNQRNIRIQLVGYDQDKKDNENLTYTINSNPRYGTLKRVGRTRDTFSYTPNKDYYGTDQFVFTVTDPTRTSSQPAIVDIIIRPIEQKRTTYTQLQPEDNNRSESDDSEGGSNMLMILLGVVVLLGLAAAGGGGGDGGSPTGGVDIGITIP